MQKNTLYFVLFNFMSLYEITMSAATSDSLSRTTSGQAALELSRMHPAQAAILIEQMNSGIVAQIFSPAVMSSEVAAPILNNLKFGKVAHIFRPNIMASQLSDILKREMVKKAPAELVRGFREPGVMDPSGTHEGNVAMFLSKHVSSDDAAKKLYSMKAATVARILAPTITKPDYAEAVWIAAAILDPVQMYLSSSLVHQRSSYSSYGEGGERGHGNSSQISGQALGVSAGCSASAIFHGAELLFELVNPTDTHCAPSEQCMNASYCPSGGCIYNDANDVFSVLDRQK